MPNDFLKTQVFPGEAIPHHEYRKLIVVLVIVLIVAIVVGVGLWWNASQTPSQQAPASVAVDERTRMVNQALLSLKDAKPSTQAEVQSALKQLSQSKTKVTQSQIDQALNQLKAR